MLHDYPTSASGGAVAKLAYRIDEAVAASGLARTAIFEAIQRGELRSFRAGKRRLVMAESLRDHIERLASRDAA